MLSNKYKIISLIFFFVLSITNIYGQSIIDVVPKTPQPAQFQPININLGLSQNSSIVNNNYSQNRIEEQNQILRQQAGMTIPGSTNRNQELAEYRKDLKEAEANGKKKEYEKEVQAYYTAFNVLKKFNPDNFSLTNAIYVVENAFYNNELSYAAFAGGIQLKAALVKQILKREGIDANNNVALNYGIQKLFSQPNVYNNPKTHRSTTFQPFRYDFNDFMGEKDWRNMFVSKVLATGKGQCNSLPELYLAIAEQLGAKAYLSLAPEHSFIQFFDNQNNRLTFETTNGNLVSQNWILQSGFINAAALKNKIYLDTLSKRQLLAKCFSDLLLGYEKKFGYDDFTKEILKKVKEIDSASLTVKLVLAEIKTNEFFRKVNAIGRPPVQDLPKYPAVYKAYLEMQQSYKDADDMGYQQMPKEAYQAWRSSIDKEKKKQETLEMQEQMKEQIEMLKRLKPTLVRKPIEK